MGNAVEMKVIGEDFLCVMGGEINRVPSNNEVMEELEHVAEFTKDDPVIKAFDPDMAELSDQLRNAHTIKVTIIDEEGEKGTIERSFNYESPAIRYLRALAKGEVEVNTERKVESKDVAKHVVDVLDKIESPRVRVKMNQRSIREVCEVCAQI